MFKIEFFQVAKTLLRNNNFIITTHVNPDADAIGSQLAIAYILKKINKKINLINYSALPYNLKFLDVDNLIEQYNPELHDDIIKKSECLIVVDLNRLNRTVKMEKVLREFSGEIIFIDHHEFPENINQLLLLDTNYSSTGELIYDLINYTKIVEIDKNIADSLYSAIMTDTGSFRFDRTTSDTHKKIADLIDKGANPNKLYENIYDQGELSRLNLLGLVLSEIKTIYDGKLAYMLVTQEMLIKTNCNEEEVDGFINYCISVKGVRIGVLFFELKNGIKISFRSRGEIAVNKLASEFGGGGHLNAAGTRLYNCTLNEYFDKVLVAAEKYLEE